MVARMDARRDIFPRGVFADFLLATAVLTRVPVGAAPPGTGSPGEAGVAASSWAFPLVGAGVGGIAGSVLLAAQVLGCGDVVAALLAILAALVVTGALHEDGLADTIDGFGGGKDRDHKLAIMRDSRVGAYGVLALILGIGLRIGALAAIGGPVHAGLALIATHAASRGFLPAAMRLMRPARPDGLAAEAGRPSLTVTTVALAGGLAIALGCLGPLSGLVMFAIGGAAATAMAALARHQIGGYTGDVLGAIQQVGEITMLLVAAAK